MIETIKDLSEHLRARAKNVLYSSFIISFFIVNWDSFYLLFFSKTEAVQTLTNVNLLYSGNGILQIPLFILKLVIYPLMASCAHIFIVSYFSEIIYERWAKHQTKMNDIASRSSNSRLLTVEVAQKIRKENIELRVENDRLKSEHIEELKVAKDEDYSALDFYRDSIQGTFEERLIKLQESQYNILSEQEYENILVMKKAGTSQYTFDRQIHVKRSIAENFRELAHSLGFIINYPNTTQDQVYLGAIRWKN